MFKNFIEISDAEYVPMAIHPAQICLQIQIFQWRAQLWCQLQRQMSTSRVDLMTPWENAAKPPTKTNSACASINLQVNSARFCISSFHSRAQRIAEIDNVVVCQNAFPRRHCKTVVGHRRMAFTSAARICSRTFLQNPFCCIRHENQFAFRL